MPPQLANGQHAEGKALWVVRDGDITIENFEFRGARVPDGNGAAIRFEQGQLTVRGCVFLDNENGILTSNHPTARLRISGSEFGQAPRHEGLLHHLIYVGRIAHATIEKSHFHDGYLGHLIKSRARESVITGNTIVDGPNGRASYEIDLPNGGLARVTGNLIAQGALTDNPAMVSFGAEGSAWPGSVLTVEDNQFINDRPEGGTFVRAWPDRLPAESRVIVRRNRLIGRGRLELGPDAIAEGNVEAPRP